MTKIRSTNIESDKEPVSPKILKAQDPEDFQDFDDTEVSEVYLQQLDGVANLNLQEKENYEEQEDQDTSQELYDFLNSSPRSSHVYEYVDTDSESDEELELATRVLDPKTELGPERTTIVVLREHMEKVEADGGNRRVYMLATDLASESLYAFESAIETVVKPGDKVHVVNVLEEDKLESRLTAEDERLEAAKKVTIHTKSLLKNSPIPFTVIIHAVIAKSLKSMLMEMIDIVKPTMLIVGSRGRGTIKGMLLGSVSNYLVQNSPVPVMVARRHVPKKISKYNLNKLEEKKRKQKAVLNQLREAISAAKLEMDDA